jgi:hypothetical protein
MKYSSVLTPGKTVKHRLTRLPALALLAALAVGAMAHFLAEGLVQAYDPNCVASIGPGASLESCDLTNAYLPNSTLNDTELDDANLSGTILTGSNLTGADLSSATLADTYTNSVWRGRKIQ